MPAKKKKLGLEYQLESGGGAGGGIGGAAPKGAGPATPAQLKFNFPELGGSPTAGGSNVSSAVLNQPGNVFTELMTGHFNSLVPKAGMVAGSVAAGFGGLLGGTGLVTGLRNAGVTTGGVQTGGGTTSTSGPKEGDVRTDFADGIAREWRNGGWRLMSATPAVTPEVTPGVIKDPEIEEEIAEEVASERFLSNSNVARFLRENNIDDIYRPSTNLEDYIAESRSIFRDLYGDSPNFDELEEQYLNAIREAYNEILGEGGTLDQARDIADRQFGIAEGQMQRGFRESRRQLAEQAFLGQRQMQQQLAERGLGGSGLAQLGVVQQKIAEGGAASSLYRQFVESLEQLSVSRSESELKFADARANLTLALTRDTQDISNRFRQERQQYNQFKGSTILAIAEAARQGNYQSYQMELDRFNRGLQIASTLDDDNRTAAQDQIAVTEQTYDALRQTILADPKLTDKQKELELAKIEVEKASALNEITAGFGLTSGDIVSNIMGDRTPSEFKQGVFQDEEGGFSGVIPAIPRGIEAAGGGIVRALFGDRAANIYDQIPSNIRRFRPGALTMPIRR